MAMDPEVKFGIRGAGQYGAKTFEQKFALVAGLVYVGIGVIGFAVTGFNGLVAESNEALLGIFLLNPFHNIVHIAIGGLWLFGALVLSPAGTEGINIAIGGVYILATVLGFIGSFGLLNIRSGLDPDNFLHLVSGLLPLLLGSGLFRVARGEAVSA
ncbi:MAG: DUF4383 domain-containing protein [Pseudonocardiaceae bacterium]